MKSFFLPIIFLLFPASSIIGQKNAVSKSDIEVALRASVLRLTDYINYCGTNNTDAATKENNLELILQEFIEGAKMEVSNVFKDDVKELPVKKYFRNLIYLKEENDYTKVFFTYSKIRVDNLKKIGINKYTATGEYTQIFQAYRGRMETYADITVKFCDIYVWVENNTIDVKFGDTKVSSTEKLIKLKG